MSSHNTHSASGSALGYYYQAVYALRQLLLEDEPDASVSIESWDDVFIEKGSKRELHQLKHKLDLSKTIGIKSPDVWRTLTVWLDYCEKHGIFHSKFFLATVATLQPGSPLECLRDPSASRSTLSSALNEEAERVLAEREKAKTLGIPENKWPHAERWKDCARYLNASQSERDALLKRTSLFPNSFSMADAKAELGTILSRLVPATVVQELTKQLLAWWDREVVETLTRERTEPLQAEEIRSFVVKRAAMLLDNGFFEDTETYYAAIEPSAPGVKHQLDFIEAKLVQRKRAIEMEMRARAQRAAWMTADLSKATALRKYDRELIEEWSYRFEEKVEECEGKGDATKISRGRSLLDWSHFDAPLQVRRIDSKYDNLDFIRGTYVYLSGDGSVGWHPDYRELLEKTFTESKGREK
jgi:hypothetical protein